MQVQKKDIRDKILTTARKEFLEKGYRKTSMRTIAKKSEVTLSNIYNYFKNKDEILEVILKPVLSALDEKFSLHNEPANISTQWFEIKKVTELKEFKEQMNFLIKYNKELNLLFHKCAGSKYENIKDEIIDRYTVTTKEYLELMKEKYPQVNKDISDFFIHVTAAWWIQVLSEIVSHMPSEEDILKFGKEYLTFGAAGWQRLMNL